LDLYPKAPVAAIHYNDGILEVPTIPSDLEILKDQIMGLNLPALGVQTHTALASLQQALDELSANVGPLSGRLSSTLQDADTAIHSVQFGATRTMSRYDRLADVTQDQISGNGERLTRVLRNAEEAMIKTNVVLASLEDISGPRSASRDDLESSLRDLAASASSLREFTHDLERHPAGALLRRSSP